jgi:hypothetical protein
MHMGSPPYYRNCSVFFSGMPDINQCQENCLSFSQLLKKMSRGQMDKKFGFVRGMHKSGKNQPFQRSNKLAQRLLNQMQMFKETLCAEEKEK